MGIAKEEKGYLTLRQFNEIDWWMDRTIIGVHLSGGNTSHIRILKAFKDELGDMLRKNYVRKNE